MKKKADVGIIGGSGFYSIEGFKFIEEIEIETPFGKPSYKFTLFEVKNKTVAFLPRHGKHHTLLPSEINFRANIYGMKMLGIERIISVSAVGSLKEELPPKSIVLVSQFFDRTFKRENTFFGDGIVAHVSFAEPICPEMRKLLYNTGLKLGIKLFNGGTYVTIEGPSFSTKAESHFYRQFGFDVIGMTNATEAKLAREAGICYATIAIVTDYDCWKEEEESVTVDMIIENFKKSIETAKRLISSAIPEIPERSDNCNCKDALKNAIVTHKEAITEEKKEKLKYILEGVL